MPKISVLGGPTNKAEYQVREAGDESPLPPVPEDAYGPDSVPLEEAGEQPSAGTNSSPSTPKTQSTPEQGETPLPSPARTTASRSKKPRKAASSARSTATGGHATGSSDTDSQRKE